MLLLLLFPAKLVTFPLPKPNVLALLDALPESELPPLIKKGLGIRSR